MLDFILENKEIFFSGLGATIIGIVLTAIFKKKNKKKTVINKYITNKTINNNTTNNTNNTNTNTTNTTNSNNKYNNYKSNNHISNKNNSGLQQKNNTYTTNLKLTSIRLYSTGAKGKVYTNIFHKELNHNFGIELIIKNGTNQLQRVKIGWCIYDNNGKTLLQGTFHEKIAAHTSFQKDFYVDENIFRKLHIGKYKSQFWLNDKKVQKEYFKIKYK